jgi:microcystin-dependent protein
MAFFNYPASVDKNTPAVAVEVQTNFDAVLAWIMDNLIQKDGTVAMTAPLVLAPGDPAAPNQAVNKAYVDAVRLVGEMVEYAGTALPAKYLWCDGQTYTNTSQPLLAAAIGRNFTAAAVPAGSFSVPDRRGKFSMGVGPSDALGKGSNGTAAGQRDTEIRAHRHTVPVHGHGASGSSNQVDLQHQHPVNIVTNTTGHHDHGWGTEPFLYNGPESGYGLAAGGGIRTAVWSPQGNHNHSVDGFTGVNHFDGGRFHSHTIGVTVNNQPAFDTTDTGAGTTLVDKNLPPYVAVNYIIYAGA